MTTQIIRDTAGVITTGKFCLFGGSRPKQEEEVLISCFGAGSNIQFTMMFSTTAGSNMIEEAVNATIATVNGVTKQYEELLSDSSLFYIFEMDDEFTVPEGFVTDGNATLVVSNITSNDIKLSLRIPTQYKDVIRFIPLPTSNPSMVGTSSSIHACLAVST